MTESNRSAYIRIPPRWACISMLHKPSMRARQTTHKYVCSVLVSMLQRPPVAPSVSRGLAWARWQAAGTLVSGTRDEQMASNVAGMR
jgi:hypothetical protein